MMNRDKYQAILQAILLPPKRKNFHDTDGIFEQDLAPCQTSRKMRTFFDERELKVLDWPGNFSHIYTIENLWDII